MQTEIVKALNGSAPKTNNPAIACVMALAAQSYKTPDVVGLICDITPETARTLLSFRDERQRTVNKPRVQAYVRDMRANRWHSMGMPVLLSTEGTLIDGQHRLHAVVESGFVWIRERARTRDGWYSARHQYIVVGRVRGSSRTVAEPIDDVVSGSAIDVIATLVRQSTRDGEVAADPTGRCDLVARAAATCGRAEAA